MNNEKQFDVVIIGGGVSGTALFYTLAQYTDINKIAIIEKYGAWGQVNSKSNNNSQTLHIGDIETNYSLEKATLVKPAALMIPQYVNMIGVEARDIVSPVSKMVLAVGEHEVAQLEKRYTEFRELYPTLNRLERNEIAIVEPEVIKGRDPSVPILALHTQDGHAVDYEALSASFVKQALASDKRDAEIFLNTEVVQIKKLKNEYKIITKNGSFHAKVVIVNTDAYSLYFAKSLGYGKQYSLIPVAGSFYFSKELLNGKVYTMQDKKLPFAAVHGDPDIKHPGVTRWGPTAKMSPVLESRNFKTTHHYFHSASIFRWKTFKSVFKILSDKTRFIFLLKNTAYDMPIIGKHLFLHNVQKIVPSIRASDLKRAKGFGGMRLQRIDTNKDELQLGEGKIIGDKIIFNMTPSPGASVCLFNGMRDAENIMKFFDGKYSFDKSKMEKELDEGKVIDDTKTTTENTYVS